MSDPLIDALTAPREPSDVPGRSARELADEIGRSSNTVLNMIRRLHAAGRIKVHRVPRKCIDGRMLHTTTYELIDGDD